MESKHQDLNVYVIKPLNGKGPMHKMNWQQLFNLQKTQGSDTPSNPAPDTILPTLLVKKPTRGFNNSPTCTSVRYHVQDPSKHHGVTITL